MLKKLIKHEWKSTYKIGLILLAVLGGITLLGALGSIIPIRYIVTNLENETAADSQALAGVMLMFIWLMWMLYVFTLVGVFYVMIGYQSVHFYKTMYTDEGYLTHTLPATPGQILNSKLLVSGCWNLIMMLGVLLSYAILGVAVISSLESVLPMWDVWGAIGEGVDEMIQEGYGLTLFHFGVSMLCSCLLSPFCVMMMLFAGLTIGQLARKHKLLLGIVSCVGIMMGSTIITQIVRSIMMITSYTTNDPMAYISFTMGGALDCVTLVTLAISVGLYFLTRQILSKKLNLD